MPMEFVVPTLRIAVEARLPMPESERCRMESLMQLEEDRLHAQVLSDVVQDRRKKFVDRHRRIKFLQ